MTQDYKLVLLESKAEYAAEGEKLRHAVGHYYDYFQQKGVQAYSLRKDGESLLTLSVQPERYTSHIVGLHNRPPTPEEFEILVPLLAAQGIENRYDPRTLS